MHIAADNFRNDAITPNDESIYYYTFAVEVARRR
jgi:hypothetical protein